MNGDLTSLPLILSLDVKTKVLTNSTYEINITFALKMSLKKIHFSQIIFDQNGIDSSMLYQVIFYYHDFPTLGGSLPVQFQFMENFIIGLLEIKSGQKKATLSFDITYRYNATGQF